MFIVSVEFAASVFIVSVEFSEFVRPAGSVVFAESSKFKLGGGLLS